MDKIVIEGGVRLNGEVEISGAKNAALPILVSSLLVEGRCTIHNIPKLRDIDTIRTLLESFGVVIEETGDKSLSLDASRIHSFEAPYDLVRTMRASILVLGPLVARFGRAKVSLPGGCAIGARPINLHLKGLKLLGADVTVEHGYVFAEAKRLKGSRIYFDIPTVTGTENVMMAAVFAEGRSILENAACEPEVKELADVLNKMGARIEGAGTETIVIDGVSSLKPVEHRIIPDRIEAGTYLVVAGITGGDITIKDCPVEYMDAIILKLRETGIEIAIKDGIVRVRGGDTIKSADVKTLPYPGFPTDMQAQFMSLMSISNGISVVTETVFENRFMHVSELRRMGADIRIEGHSAFIKGVKSLSGAPVMATDLRSSASLILAGLVADGITEIRRVYHLDRGYERIEEKLSRLGARIKRLKDRYPV